MVFDYIIPFALHQALVLCLVVVPILILQNCQLLQLALFTSLIHFEL